MKTTLEPLERVVPPGGMYCFDCGCWPEEYMLRDEVWLEAWPEYAEVRRLMWGRVAMKVDPDRTLRAKDREEFHRAIQREREFLLLCFSCVEKRLGRLLVLGDFKDAPINRAIRLGVEMARREGRDWSSFP